MMFRELAWTLQTEYARGRWKNQKSFNELNEAKEYGRLFDPDGLLIGVRIRCPDGSFIKPKSVYKWDGD